MPKVARVGDTSDHGGHIVAGSPTTFADGIAVARIGDDHYCPIPGHGTTPIVSTPNTNTKADGLLVAVVGAEADCGAIINVGSPTTNAQ